MIDWILGLLIVAAVALVVWKKVKDGREGKPGCGCGCSGCTSKKKKCDEM
ncbi:MAG: FeoB-associated Cys-rich membrane protein [Lachnospiraceae bacterium]